MSGFDVGIKKSYGSFFSSLRERTEFEREKRQKAIIEDKNDAASPSFIKTGQVNVNQGDDREDDTNKSNLEFKSKYYNLEQMSGREYVQQLVKQQEDRYQKKYPFERGQYH